MVEMYLQEYLDVFATLLFVSSQIFSLSCLSSPICRPPLGPQSQMQKHLSLKDATKCEFTFRVLEMETTVPMLKTKIANKTNGSMIPSRTR